MQPVSHPKRAGRSRRLIWTLAGVLAIVVLATVVAIGVSGEQPTATRTPIAVPEPTITLPSVAPAASSAAIPSTAITVTARTEAAARTAISQAKSGGVVVFPAGTYAIRALALKAGVRYVGVTGAVITSSESNAFHCDDCSGVSIEGFTFDGGNLNLGSDNTVSKSVKVINNVFTDVKSPEFGFGQALFLNHIQQLTVSANTFTDDGTIDSQNAIIGYDLNSATISRNVLRNVYQGIHIETHQAFGNDLVIRDNWISGLSRMGIEIQGYSSSMVVSGNVVTGWHTTQQGNRIGLSIVTRGPGKTTLRDNTVVGVGIKEEPALEFMGLSSTVEGNVLYGFGSGVSVSCATGTSFAANRISAFGRYGAFSRDGGYCGGERIGENVINGVSEQSSL